MTNKPKSMTTEDVLDELASTMHQCEDVESSGVRCVDDSVIQPGCWCGPCREAWLIGKLTDSMITSHNYRRAIDEREHENGECRSNGCLVCAEEKK